MNDDENEPLQLRTEVLSRRDTEADDYARRTNTRRKEACTAVLDLALAELDTALAELSALRLRVQASLYGDTPVSFYMHPNTSAIKRRLVTASAAITTGWDLHQAVYGRKEAP